MSVSKIRLICHYILKAKQRINSIKIMINVGGQRNRIFLIRLKKYFGCQIVKVSSGIFTSGEPNHLNQKSLKDTRAEVINDSLSLIKGVSNVKRFDMAPIPPCTLPFSRLGSLILISNTEAVRPPKRAGTPPCTIQPRESHRMEKWKITQTNALD
jgi:hypothetical protein